MSAVLAIPVRSDANYCERCSPYGFPFGEPGCDCTFCGRPMILTTEQVAASRALRNRVALARQQAGLASPSREEAEP